MHAARIAVDVVMERVPVASRWASERWQPAAVVPAVVAGVAPPMRISDAPHERWRFAGLAVELHVSEAEGYFLNLTAPDPKAFVLWRTVEGGTPPAQPLIVTVSYNEAGRFMDGGEQVDAVVLPDALAAVMRSFVAAHYVPQARRKVRRNDPFAAGPTGEPGRG